MLEVVLRPRAQQDVENAYLYIALVCDAPRAARGLVDAVYERIEQVRELPNMGSVFESDELERSYRRILVKDYWLFYTHNEETVTIWRFVHTKRDIDDFALVSLE